MRGIKVGLRFLGLSVLGDSKAAGKLPNLLPLDLAASKSSVSGKPYQVMCGNAAPVESKVWLIEELKAVRSGSEDKVINSK